MCGCGGTEGSEGSRESSAVGITGSGEGFCGSCDLVVDVVEVRWFLGAGAGTARIRDSAEELRARAADFSEAEDVEGRRGELALMCWRGRDAWPSRLGSVESSCWSGVDLLEASVDVASADGASSRVRGLRNTGGFDTIFADCGLLWRGLLLLSSRPAPTGASIEVRGFNFASRIWGVALVLHR